MKSLALALLLVIPPLTASAAPALSAKDTAVVSHQHAVNAMEIDMGGMALKQGTVAIKAYATNLVKDHKAADAKLATFAKGHAIAPIPDDQEATDEDKKANAAEMTKLMALKGTDFDKEFLTAMVDGHTKEVAKVDTDLGVVTDPALATMLRSVKPVMQKHADQARDLDKGTPAKK